MLSNGKPGEYFKAILHIKATDAASIADALTTFIVKKQLDYKNLVGQA